MTRTSNSSWHSLLSASRCVRPKWWEDLSTLRNARTGELSHPGRFSSISLKGKLCNRSHKIHKNKAKKKASVFFLRLHNPQNQLSGKGKQAPRGRGGEDHLLNQNKATIQWQQWTKQSRTWRRAQIKAPNPDLNQRGSPGLASLLAKANRS